MSSYCFPYFIRLLKLFAVRKAACVRDAFEFTINLKNCVKKTFKIQHTLHEEVGRLKRTLWGAFELISSEDYSLPCGNTTEASSTARETLRDIFVRETAVPLLTTPLLNNNKA